MKKFLKVFSSFCLVLVVGAAVLLSGCSKKFNINISASVGGEVLMVGSESVSVIGDNEVEQGKTFKFAIQAAQGYYISKVIVNDNSIDLSSWEKDDNGYLMYHIYAMSEVAADAKITVTFAAQIKTLTFQFIDTANSNALVDTVAYNVPCHKTFDLFNTDDTTAVGTLFFANASAESGLLKISLKGADATVYVKEADAADIADIETRLDGIFTTEEGCEKI